MKKKYAPIITFTVALLLVGSIAYAADKRKKARLAVPEPSELSEDALRVELLAASEDQHDKIPGTKSASFRKSAGVATAKVKVKKD